MNNKLMIIGDKAWIPYLYDAGHKVVSLDKIEPSQQVFSFTSTNWDIEKLWSMYQKRPTEYQDFDMLIRQSDVDHIMTNNGIEMPHLDRMSLERLQQPGIMIHMPDGTDIIADGNHRLVKRFQLGHDQMSFVQFRINQSRPAMLNMTGLSF